MSRLIIIYVDKNGLGNSRSIKLGSEDFNHRDAQYLTEVITELESDPKKLGGAESILLERYRQKEVEGWTSEGDAEYTKGQLVDAAVCYALHGKIERIAESIFRAIWPWDLKWFKPSTRRRDLEKSGGLLASEIDRIDRI